MISLPRVLLGTVLGLALLACAPAPGHAGHRYITDDPATWRPVVFFVNGFDGCCVPEDVRIWVETKTWVNEAGGSTTATVHTANWNALYPNAPGAPGPGCYNPFDASCNPQPDSFDGFVNDLTKELLALPREVKVVLIGHSLGAEAVLRVARHVGDRPIDFLGTLDPVGWGGLRSTVTSFPGNVASGPVPSNVGYLFNRWQITNPYPLENLAWLTFLAGPIISLPPPGKLASSAGHGSQREQNERRRRDCSIKYEDWDVLGLFPQLLEHQNVPYDACIQKRMEDALDLWVYNPNPAVVRGELVTGYDGWMQSVLGVRVVFSKQIDPASFTVDDVVGSGHAVAAIEPNADGRSFVVRFADPYTKLGSLQPHIRLLIGPGITDLAGRQLDQDRDGAAGEPEDDRYSFEVGETITLPDPGVVTFKTLAYLEGKIWDLAFTFEQPVDHALATDLNFYHLLAAGPDTVFGTADDHVIGLTAASYDAEPWTVTLSLEAPLAAGGTYRLVAAAEGLPPLGETFTIPTPAAE